MASTHSYLPQMRKGILEFCVLATLRGGPAYGLEIVSALSDHPLLLNSEGTLYPLLSRLRKQGWVETYGRESESGPPRRYYTLTDDGRTALDAFADTWAPFSRSVDRVLKQEQP